MADTIYVVTIPAITTARHTYPADTRRIEASYTERPLAARHAKGCGGFVEALSEADFERALRRGSLLFAA